MARLLEHHALEILRKAGISVPDFEVVSTAVAVLIPVAGAEPFTNLARDLVVKH